MQVIETQCYRSWCLTITSISTRSVWCPCRAVVDNYSICRRALWVRCGYLQGGGCQLRAHLLRRYGRVSVGLELTDIVDSELAAVEASSITLGRDVIL